MPYGMLQQIEFSSILVCTVSVFIQISVSIHAHSVIGGAAIQRSKLGGPQAYICMGCLLVTAGDCWS